MKAKKECYPRDISIRQVSAEQPLQSLLDHTSQRLILNDSVKEKLVSTLIQKPNESLEDMQLKCKWGFDGSTGQSRYKQRFNEHGFSDKNLFSTMLVPLELTYRSTVIWSNPVSSSTRFCRPIKLLYESENSDLVRAERSRVENQVKELTRTVVKFVRDQDEYELGIQHNLRLTMIDGSAVDAISNNSSHRVCNICKASPTQMNEKSKLATRESIPNMLDNGLSVLHAIIRCFECILHISYRLPIKSWQIRGEEAKQLCNVRKRHIQSRFMKELGLLVDFPKDSGSGKIKII